MANKDNSIVIMTHKQQHELIESAVRKALRDYQLQHEFRDNQTRLLTAKETQQMLGCSATTLWRLGKLPDGGLYPVRLGPHKIAYKLDDIEEYITSQITNKR
ncbi:MAG: hypothetical protein IJL35_04295 [Bacteroidaceae bacterium]|nr:hypothetical protein [Bacteroidaceae bacterium]